MRGGMKMRETGIVALRQKREHCHHLFIGISKKRQGRIQFKGCFEGGEQNGLNNVEETLV